jgi:plastocyanin
MITSLLPALLVLTACAGAGPGSSASPPASGGAARVTAVATTSSAAGNALTEVATDNKFAQTAYVLDAGASYTLTLVNEGQAIHNWHILNAKGSDGKEITSRLVDPGKSDRLTFSLSKPGTYRFLCDVHPDEMKGTITVQ